MISAERERELLGELAKGGPSRQRALAELVEQTAAPLQRLALKLTGSVQGAEDAVQETFAAVLRSIENFRGEAKLSTWIFRIALREALRPSVRRRPVGELSEMTAAAGGDPSDVAEEREGLQRLLRAIAALPPGLRVVVALAGIQELPRAQVAEILGLPVGTVHSRLHEARARLRERLGLPGAPMA